MGCTIGKKNHHKVDDIKTPQNRWYKNTTTESCHSPQRESITNSPQSDVIQAHYSDVTQSDAIQIHHKGRYYKLTIKWCNTNPPQSDVIYKLTTKECI